jgi:very-short-patch-repair endonuclease
LIVELDGGQHADNKEYDEKRDAFLRSRGFRVIRIWHVELLQNLDNVLDMLSTELNAAPSP